MKRFLLEVLSCVSRLINVLTGGTPDMTFSARSYRDSLWTQHLIDGVTYFLFGQKDHCRVSWDAEVTQSIHNINLAETLRETKIYEAERFN